MFLFVLLSLSYFFFFHLPVGAVKFHDATWTTQIKNCRVAIRVEMRSVKGNVILDLIMISLLLALMDERLDYVI